MASPGGPRLRLVLLLVAGIVLLWLKGPRKKTKINWIHNLVLVFLVIAGTAGVTNLAVKAGIVEDYFPNLAYGYRDNGFVYCFLNTWLNTGISKPDNYTKDSIQSLFTKEDFENLVAAKGDPADVDTPNIIFVQLESFMEEFSNILARNVQPAAPVEAGRAAPAGR